MKIFKSKEERELNKIIKQTISLLREQIDIQNRGSSLWKKRLGSEFALGYIFGYSLMLIGSKTKNEKERAMGVEKIFNNLFGKKNGIRVLATAKQFSNSPHFKEGYEVAKKDLIEFIDENSSSPSGLSNYLNKSI